MLAEPPVTEGRAAAAAPTSAGGSSSTGALVAAGAACATCGGERPPLAVAHGDPFCRTKCAREFYGCPLDPATERPLPKVKLAA